MQVNDTKKPGLEPKPYTSTSYFWLLIGSIVSGPLLIFGSSYLLPYLPLSDTQGAKMMETVFNGWLTLVAITTAGNVTARGAVTVLKTLLQNQIAQSTPAADLTAIAKSAARQELAGHLGLSTAPPVPNAFYAVGDETVDHGFMVDDVELSGSSEQLYHGAPLPLGDEVKL